MTSTEAEQAQHTTAAAAEPVDRSGVRAMDYVRIDPHVFEAALPALAFIVANYASTTQVAIGASFAVAVVVFVRNPQRGVIRALGALGFGIVALTAVIGLVLGSGKAYIAQNIVADFAIAAVFTASVLVGRPIIGVIAREISPILQPVLPERHRVFVLLTFASVAINLVQGTSRIFLLDALSENMYVVLSRAVFIPVNVAFYVFAYWAVARAAIHDWPDDLAPPERIRGN